MTDCQDWLTELTYTGEQILNEDLASLNRMPDRMRIERYNEIKSDEEEFQWEYGRECGDFLTSTEQDRVRGEIRLARLLIAASFYAEGELPKPMENDFIDAELQAVIEFDRYKQFDALDQDQIEGRIRRMEGEVYELVTEYTSTQIADMDELIDNPEVQQDVMERLVDRYDDRRERIRQGFFVYVETHGMEHMVEGIEQAIDAAAAAATERKHVQTALESEIDALESSLETEFQQQRTRIKSTLQDVESDIINGTVDIADVRAELDSATDLSDEPLTAIDTAIERTKALGATLDEKIAQLQEAQEAAQASGAEEAEDAVTVVESELERAREQRSKLNNHLDRLHRERDQIEYTRDRLAEQKEALETQVTELESDDDTVDPRDVNGADVVTASTARLFEMDYIGRFDTKMHEATTIELPDQTFDVPEGYWDGRSQRQSDAPRVEQLLDADEQGRADSYPANLTARYEITKSRYLGLSTQTEIILEATVFSDLRAYASNGFDESPADIDDLLGLINNAVREADQRETHYLLAIASPTGWTERVEEKIEADEFARTHYSRRLSTCLVDLRDGTLIYDESDDVISDNVTLFERPVNAERITQCVDQLRSAYIDSVGRETIGLDEVVSTHEFDPHVVKQAFRRVEEDGDAEQFYVEGDGLALDVS